MKSLEIVNRNIKAIKKLLRNLQNAKEGTKEDFDKYYHEQELKEQLEIKQDLEVLEIINKKDVDIRELKLLCFGILGNGIGTIEDTLKVYNTPRSPKCQLTLEELLKLKQWLEENE